MCEPMTLYGVMPPQVSHFFTIFRALEGVSALRATFTLGLPGMDWLSPPHKMPPKESKPLGKRPVQTSLRLALSGASPCGDTQDGPLGATTSLVWGIPARLSIFPALVQIVEGNYSSSGQATS